MFGDLSDAFVGDVSQISAFDSFTVLRANKIMGQFSNTATLSDFQPGSPERTRSRATWRNRNLESYAVVLDTDCEAGRMKLGMI